MKPITVTINEPSIWQATAELRWALPTWGNPDRVLQQRWVCIGGADFGSGEWRDVPTED